MENNNITLIGVLAGLTGFLGIIIKYFVDALNRKDTTNDTLTEKIIDITKDNIESRNKLAASIDIATEATKQQIEVSKQQIESTQISTDKLSQLLLQALEKKQNQ